MQTTPTSPDATKPLLFTVATVFVGAMALFLAFGLYLQIDFLVQRTESYGRVVKWDGDLVYMRYAGIEGDSIVSRKQLPYARDKAFLASHQRVPVLYHRNDHRKFEILGVDDSGYLSVAANLVVAILVGWGALWWLRRYRNRYKLNKEQD